MAETPSPALVVRFGLVLSACVAIGWIGSLVLGEYQFSGDGIQWLAVIGGVGLGGIMAWVTKRLLPVAPPNWLIAVVGLLAVLSETRAVDIDTGPKQSWPVSGTLAVIGAGVAASYGLMAARKDSAQNS